MYVGTDREGKKVALKMIRLESDKEGFPITGEGRHTRPGLGRCALGQVPWHPQPGLDDPCSGCGLPMTTKHCVCNAAPAARLLRAHNLDAHTPTHTNLRAWRRSHPGDQAAQPVEARQRGQPAGDCAVAQ